MATSERADPLTNEAPDGPRLTRFDWDKIAAEEAAKLELEEREEAEAAKRTKGADASSRDAPRSAAEAEERRKREALREAKNAWLERDAADLAAKLVVGEGERGAKPRTNHIRRSRRWQERGARQGRHRLRLRDRLIRAMRQDFRRGLRSMRGEGRRGRRDAARGDLGLRRLHDRRQDTAGDDPGGWVRGTPRSLRRARALRSRRPRHVRRIPHRPVPTHRHAGGPGGGASRSRRRARRLDDDER